MRRAVVLLILLLLALQPAYPVFSQQGYRRTVSLLIPAVSRLENGTYVGAVSRLEVSVVHPGKGRVFFSAEPLTELDTQATARVASLVASYLAGVDYRRYDFYVSIESPSMIIGGPSAGMAITVGMLACLLGDRINASVIGTGMVNPDGTVGPVGGIPEKLEASARRGAKLFLVPAGQMVVYRTVVEEKRVGGAVIYTTRQVPVNLGDLGHKLGVKVVEVASIREAYAYYTGHRLPAREVELGIPSSFASMLHRWIKRDTATAEKMVEEALSLKANLTRSDEARYLEALASTTRQLLSKSNQTLSRGMPYSAASYAFQALVYAEYARAAARFMASGDAGSIVSELLKEANETLRSLEEKLRPGSVDIGALEGYIAASLRYRQAIEAMNKAEELLSHGFILDTSRSWGALHEAAYAKWRAATARNWLETTNITRMGHSVSRQELAELTASMLYQAESMTSYAETLYGDISTYTGTLQDALNDYTGALEEYREERLLSALGLALRSTVEATIAIHQAFSTNASRILEAAYGEAIDALARLSSTGLSPITPQSYLEFGRLQEDVLSKLYFYELAAAYAKTLYSLALAVLGGSGEAATTTQPHNTNTTGMPQITVITETTTLTKTVTVAGEESGGSVNLWMAAATLMLGVVLGAAFIAAARREHY